MSRFSPLNRFDPANVRLRVISAVILLPIVLLAVYLGDLGYGVILTIVAVLGLREWLHLVAPAVTLRTVVAGCVMLILMMTAAMLFSPAFGAMLGMVFALILFLIASHDDPEQAGWITLGIPYMGGWGLAMLSLRLMPYGDALVFYVLAVVWGTDIGAFISGRLIGGPKLMPTISPSKTWAGLIGGIILGLILGYLVAVFFGARHPMVTLVLSPVLTCIAQLGDLFESAFKRRSGVKESGDLIPGHGGILDRIDGLVFAGIFACLFQAAIGELLQWW